MLKKLLQKIFEYSSPRKNPQKNIFLSLAQVIAADEVVDESEIRYLLMISQKYGFDIDNPAHLLQTISTSNKSVVKLEPFSEPQALHFIDDLVNVALVDGYLHRKEIEKCQEIATKVGLKPRIILHLVKANVLMTALELGEFSALDNSNPSQDQLAQCNLRIAHAFLVLYTNFSLKFNSKPERLAAQIKFEKIGIDKKGFDQFLQSLQSSNS